MIKKDNVAHSHPMVAIVGRPNVGKSALFNRLAGRNIAIVHDRPGVTRDRLTAICQRGSFPFEIMDTGGIGETIADEFNAQVQAEAQLAIEVADVIVFVVDGKTGMTPVDQTLAGTLRRTTKPIVVAVNKIDDDRKRNDAADFATLGFEHTAAVSAAHGLGIDSLVKLLTRLLEPRRAWAPEAGPEPTGDAAAQKPPLKLAIVGRPNAGKSSLINSVLGEQRTIVSAVAGTTRDSIDIPCIIKGRRYLLIDTAGMRRKAKIHDEVETFSSLRAAASIRRADLCLLVVDCAEGAKSQDRKIASLIVEYGKPCIIVLNKYDLFHPDASQGDRIEKLMEAMGREFFFMRYAPMIAISAKNAQYLQKLFSAVEDVVDSAQHPPGTGVLNRLLHRTVENSPAALGRSGKSFNLLYATIAKDEEPRAIPVPTFILFANRADKLQDSYLRHLEDVIRTGWPAPGVPFRFSVRGKEKRGAEAGAEGRPKPPGEAKSPRKAATVPRRPDKPRRGAGRITGGMQRHRGKTDRGR